MSPLERDPRTGKRYLSARGRQWALIVILVIAGAFSIKGYTDNNRQDAQDAAHRAELQAAALESCEVGNRARLIRIRDYRRDIAQLRAQVDTLKVNAKVIGVVPNALLRSLDLTMPEIQAINARTILTTEESIAYKQLTIRDEIASVAETAIEPGSPISDCYARVRGATSSGR